MPKKLRKNKGKFLMAELSSSKKELIRQEFPKWYAALKKENGDDVDMSPELLADFVDHLGYKHRDFRDIPDAMLSTRLIGTRHIYDYIKKRVGRVDEKVLPNRTSKLKQSTSPTKAENAKAPESKAT